MNVSQLTIFEIALTIFEDCTVIITTLTFMMMNTTNSHDESAALNLINIKHEQPSNVEVRAASSFLSSLLMQQQQRQTVYHSRGVAASSSLHSFQPRNTSKSKLGFDPSVIPSTKGRKGKGGRRWVNAPLIPDYKRTGGAPRSSTMISVGASTTNTNSKKKSKGRRWINAPLIPDHSRAPRATSVSKITSLPAPVAMGMSSKDDEHLSQLQVYLREHCCEFFEAG